MSRELLPCPFCQDKGRPRLIEQEDEDGRFAAVICDMCGCGSRQHYFCGEDARDFAASAWNARAPVSVTNDPRVVEVIEALKECVGDMELTEAHYGQHDGSQDALARARAAIANMEKKDGP